MKVGITDISISFHVNPEILKEALTSKIGKKITVDGEEYAIDIQSKAWIIKNLKKSKYSGGYNYVYKNAFTKYMKTRRIEKIKQVKEVPEQVGLGLTNEFDKVRNWASERGLYAKGDSKTQYVKLQEEAGELAKALLKDDRIEIKDAIGDMTVVLVNLAHLEGFLYEDCVNQAYSVIAKRTGSMVSGTFVKD